MKEIKTREQWEKHQAELEAEEQRKYEERRARDDRINATAERVRQEQEQREWEASVRAEAKKNGGVVPPLPSGLYDRPPAVRLPVSKPDGDAVCLQTEALLNGLIAECAALLRDVAFRSACLTSDASDRLRFIAAAQSLAKTGAKVGETVVRLRNGPPPPVEHHRHELVYTHVAAPPSPHPAEADSAHQ